MERYIHLFETEAEFNEARQNNYYEPWVSYTEGSGRVDYNKTEDEKLLGTPFTVESLGSGTLEWDLNGNQLEYSKNGGPWTTSSNVNVQLVEGDEVAFKGVNIENGFQPIRCTASFNVKGNIMSLVYGDGFKTASTLTTEYQFGGLFSSCATLVSAGGLQLPATTLAAYCYADMFQGCTGLTQAPALPATTLAVSCYETMFDGCSNLTQAPALPATTLAVSCYNGMFYGCTSLTQAPALPATTLVSACYSAMFNGCTSLNYVKAMFTTAPSSTYTASWLAGVASTGTFVKNANASWTDTGTYAVPTGWTVETASA